MNRFLAQKTGIILVSVLFAATIFLLELLGNPLNMGLCIVSFWGDTAGALNLHSNNSARYLRPEIAGLFWGAFICAVITGEWQPRKSGAFLLQLLLGICVAFGAMVFLGDTLRVFSRLGGGDINAIWGLLGLHTGIVVGIFFLATGFSLGEEQKSKNRAGLILPLLFLVLLTLCLCAPLLSNWIASSDRDVASFRVIPLLGLAAGLFLGALAQRSRLCFCAPLREAFFARDFRFLYALLCFALLLLVLNVSFDHFHFSTANQPLAHNNLLWNFLSMSLVGLATTMAGACPLRKMILAGEGDLDAGTFILGVLIGASLAHTWDIYATQGVTQTGKLAVVGGLCFCVLLFLGKMSSKPRLKMAMARGVLDARGFSPAQSVFHVRRLLHKDALPLTILTGNLALCERIRELAANKKLQVKCFFEENTAKVEVVKKRET